MSDNQNLGNKFRENLNESCDTFNEGNNKNYCEYDYRKKPFNNTDFRNDKKNNCGSVDNALKKD